MQYTFDYMLISKACTKFCMNPILHLCLSKMSLIKILYLPRCTVHITYRWCKQKFFTYALAPFLILLRTENVSCYTYRHKLTNRGSTPSYSPRITYCKKSTIFRQYWSVTEMRFYTETVCSNGKRTSIAPVRYEYLTFAASTHTGSTNLTLQAPKNIHLVIQSLRVLRPSADGPCRVS